MKCKYCGEPLGPTNSSNGAHFYCFFLHNEIKVNTTVSHKKPTYYLELRAYRGLGSTIETIRKIKVKSLEEGLAKLKSKPKLQQKRKKKTMDNYF